MATDGFVFINDALPMHDESSTLAVPVGRQENSTQFAIHDGGQAVGRSMSQAAQGNNNRQPTPEGFTEPILPTHPLSAQRIDNLHRPSEQDGISVAPLQQQFSGLAVLNEDSQRDYAKPPALIQHSFMHPAGITRAKTASLVGLTAYP